MEKTLYYFTQMAGAADALAAALADGQNAFCIWTPEDFRKTYDERGHMTGIDCAPRHSDAVEVSLIMQEKDQKNAHRIASGRAGIRNKEQQAETLLQAAAAGLLSADGRLALLALVNVAYHSSGKIEGCHSIDSCASCEFCRRMIDSAEGNTLVICGACYADADQYKEFSWRQHSLNARILSSVLFTVDELQTLVIGNLCRFNEDGDTVNDIMARNYLRIAASHPDTSFGYWYKNAPAVEAGLHAEGIWTRDALPENVRFIHSSILIGFAARALWFDDAVFTVYPDAETTAAAVAAGAHECNGRRCRECGYTCYLHIRRAEALHIAEYLRTGKDNRARIMGAYLARVARLEALAR